MNNGVELLTQLDQLFRSMNLHMEIRTLRKGFMIMVYMPNNAVYACEGDTLYQALDQARTRLVEVRAGLG